MDWSELIVPGFVGLFVLIAACILIWGRGANP